MSSVYLAGVTGDGVTPAGAFRPAGFDGFPSACLMIDTARSRCLVYSSDDTISGAGITKLISSGSKPALVTFARTTNPTTQQRAAVATWLANGGYQPLTAAQVTWWDVVMFVARQVNPAADLATIG